MHAHSHSLARLLRPGSPTGHDDTTGEPGRTNSLSKSSSRSERGTSSPHSLSHCTVRFPHPSGPPDSPCRPSPFALGKKFASVIPEMLSSLRGRGRPFARVPHPLLPHDRPGPGSDGLLKFACPSLLLLSVRPSLPSTQPSIALLQSAGVFLAYPYAPLRPRSVGLSLARLSAQIFRWSFDDDDDDDGGDDDGDGSGSIY